MSASSRLRSRVPANGSVKRPSPGRGATSETRRFQTFPFSPRYGEVRPTTPLGTAIEKALAKIVAHHLCRKPMFSAHHTIASRSRCVHVVPVLLRWSSGLA